MAPRAFSTLVFSAEARSWEKHWETLLSMSKDCLLTFALCPISTQFSSTNLSSKNKEPGKKKIHPNVFLWLWIMPIGDSFLVFFYFEANQSIDWRRVMTTFHPIASYLSVVPYGPPGPCGWGPCFIHSLPLPQSLARYLTHSVPLLSVKSMKNWNDREESWEKCLAMNSECFSISVYPEHGLFWNLISQARSEI